jgi:hypothetical protein
MTLLFNLLKYAHGLHLKTKHQLTSIISTHTLELIIQIKNQFISTLPEKFKNTYTNVKKISNQINDQVNLLKCN